ncbi:MAG: EAL domain-containing protein [Pseudohongiellaceae bacterium]|nr:EAL domain-containing protein [Pseudohongiellaceae bacterium]
MLTTVIPVALAFFYAREQGIAFEQARVNGYVQDLLYRSDRSVAQMQRAIEIISSQAECSAENIDNMRAANLLLDNVEVIGIMRGTQMICSSQGIHTPPIELGPTEIVTLRNGLLRPIITLPSAPDIEYIGLERNGVIAIAYRNEAIAPTTVREDVIVGTFTPTTGELRGATANINPAWIDRLGDQDETTFIADGYIVSIARSQQVQLTGAIAAISTDNLNARIREFTLFLLPTGLLAAALLTGLVLFLARQSFSIASDIKTGIKRNEFFLVYQPIMDLKSGEYVGAEALVRWSHNNHIIAPDEFIGAAESSSLIGLLTRHIISLAKKDASTICAGRQSFTISINLSASDLLSPEILEQLKDFKAHSGARLSVELTERVMLDPTPTRECIRAYSDAGIEVAVDDFGTGYSSLSYLEMLQFDTLKIDRLFVEAIDTEAATSRVVLHIIEMAKTLKLKIVAEGVETQNQSDFLRDNGVELAQGWLFGKPVKASEFNAVFGRKSNAFKA